MTEKKYSVLLEAVLGYEVEFISIKNSTLRYIKKNGKRIHKINVHTLIVDALNILTHRFGTVNITIKPGSYTLRVNGLVINTSSWSEAIIFAVITFLYKGKTSVR